MKAGDKIILFLEMINRILKTKNYKIDFEVFVGDCVVE